MAKHSCIEALIRAGINWDDAHSLRRISMALHRWHELECGNSDDNGSWAICRGNFQGEGDRREFIHDDDGAPFLEYHSHREGFGWAVWCRDDAKPDGTKGEMVRATRRRFGTKQAALEYMQGISPSREPELRQIWTRYTKIPDREKGARKRLATILKRYPGFQAYVQTDPRGAALYVLRPDDVKPDDDLSNVYNRGIAVFK